MMGSKEREATMEERMAKYGMIEKPKTVFANDFSADDVPKALVDFQRKLVSEAFEEELTIKEYCIKPEDVKAVKERILDVSNEMFARAEEEFGPWAAARAYCRMRLEEAEERELENKKKRLLAQIADNYLSKVKTHKEFEEVQSLILMEVGQLTAKYADAGKSDSQDVKINAEISRTLAEAAVLLIANPKEEAAVTEKVDVTEEVAITEEVAPKAEQTVEQKPEVEKVESTQEKVLKETVKRAQNEAAKVSKTVIDIKEHNKEYYNNLIAKVKLKKSGKFNREAFIKLTANEQFSLLRIAGISEDNLFDETRLQENIAELIKFIEEEDF